MDSKQANFYSPCVSIANEKSPGLQQIWTYFEHTAEASPVS